MTVHSERVDHATPPPRIAGRYEIVRPLGQGAFGRTFLGRDHGADAAGGADRLVAIKLLEPRGSGAATGADWKAHDLFEREAAVLRSLRHHGVPEVHDLLRGEWQGAAASFLVMQYVEGTSLSRVIDDQRQLDPAEVVHIFLEMLGILEYLHGRVPPILHRDIKPANIIVRPDGTPALVDFGSVRRVFLGPDETGSTVAGTYGYMPYEQYMGQATPASDLYALGATFLHLVTGRAPREFMTGEGRIEVPETLPGDPRLRPIIARLLRSSPVERFANARDVRQALLSSVAVVAAGNVTSQSVVRGVDPVLLGPTPRQLKGPVEDLMKRTCPSAWDYMDSGSKAEKSLPIFDLALFGFFCVLTAGTLPAIFMSIARARRRRVKRFFQYGVPATAELLSMRLEKTAFDQNITRVTYQYTADGELHRDTDQVLPVIADRWQPGDQLQILYIADDDYDSVIISTR